MTTVPPAFLPPPTAIEQLVPGGNIRVSEALGQVTDSINTALSTLQKLTPEMVNRLYAQWFDLDQFGVTGENQSGLFDIFCETTEKLFKLPLGNLDNTKEFVYLVGFIDRFRARDELTPLMERFRGCLPRISLGSINTARDLWKQKILSGETPDSDDPQLFFPERDTDSGYFPDLDHLKFFHNQASEDPQIEEWYGKFGKYCRS